MVDLKVNLAGIELPNPVLVASGVFGTGMEYRELVEANRLGGIVSKAVTLKPCPGNPPPRLWETPCGMLNSIGLQNKGLAGFLQEDLPALLDHGVPIIVNVAGFSQEEYLEVALGLEGVEGVSGIELNVSCPNVARGGIHFGGEAQALRDLVQGVREVYSGTLLVKLSPQVYDIGEMARVAVDAGADALSLVNTFPGMAVDVETWKPRLANVTGGLSGPAIHPLAVRAVWEVARVVESPIVAMGGISGWAEAVEMLLVGASAIAVGTAIFTDPAMPLRILEGLRGYLERKGIDSPAELKGKVRL